MHQVGGWNREPAYIEARCNQTGSSVGAGEATTVFGMAYDGALVHEQLRPRMKVESQAVAHGHTPVRLMAEAWAECWCGCQQLYRGVNT